MKAFVGFMNLLVDHNCISHKVPQQPADMDRAGGGDGLVMNTGTKVCPTQSCKPRLQTPPKCVFNGLPSCQGNSLLFFSFLSFGSLRD